MADTFVTRGEHTRSMLKKAVRKAAASEEARRTLRYVEPLSEARTPLADFFSFLLEVENVLSPATIIQRSRRMKLVIGTVATVSGVLFALSMASANPSLLPKHEGYPMKNSGSPVTGQPTANDPGQSDARGESSLMKSADSIKNAQQTLTKKDNERITTGQGANQLPTVQGPQIKIAPPVTSATKIAEDRKIE